MQVGAKRKADEDFLSGEVNNDVDEQTALVKMARGSRTDQDFSRPASASSSDVVSAGGTGAAQAVATSLSSLAANVSPNTNTMDGPASQSAAPSGAPGAAVVLVDAAAVAARADYAMVAMLNLKNVYRHPVRVPAARIVESLRAAPQWCCDALRKLNVSCRVDDMTETDFVALAAELVRFPQLRALDISYTEGLTVTAMQGFAAALPSLPLLESLDAHNTDLNDAAMKVLAAALPSVPQMRALNLQHTRMTNLAARDLAAALPRCRCLPHWPFL